MMTKIPAFGRTCSPVVQSVTFKTLYELLTLISEYQRLIISIISLVLGGSNSGIAIGKSIIETSVILQGFT